MDPGAEPVCPLGYGYYCWTAGDPISPLEPGSSVFLKPHDGKDYRGVVVEVDEETCAVMMDCDQRVRRVKLGDVRSVFRLGRGGERQAGHVGRVLVVGETPDFRMCARSQLFKSDFAVEIGSSYGDTSVILGRNAQKHVGFDCGLDCVKEAARRHPSLTFIHSDVFRESERIAALCSGCTVVAIDIGGDRCVGDQLEALQWAQSVLRPEFVLIKSRHCFKLLRERATEGIAGPLPRMSEWLQLHTGPEGAGVAQRRRTSRAGKRKKQAAELRALVDPDCSQPEQET